MGWPAGILLGAMFGTCTTMGTCTGCILCASHSRSRFWVHPGRCGGDAPGHGDRGAGRLTRVAALREAAARAADPLWKYGDDHGGGGDRGVLVAVGSGASLKHAVGIAGWVFFASYFFFVGRRAMRLET